MVTTYSTSALLKTKGFPAIAPAAPVPAFFFTSPTTYILCNPGTPIHIFSAWPQAHQSEDILKTLPGWNLAFVAGTGWVCSNGAGSFTNATNDAEAAASAWISLH